MTKRILYNTVIQNPFLMRMVGLEPTRSHLRKILSLVRLPFRHIRILVTQSNKIMIMYFETNVKKILYKNRKEAYNNNGK